MRGQFHASSALLCLLNPSRAAKIEMKCISVPAYKLCESEDRKSVCSDVTVSFVAIFVTNFTCANNLHAGKKIEYLINKYLFICFKI